MPLVSKFLCYLEAAARRDLVGTPDRTIPLSTKLLSAEGVVRTPLEGICTS